MADSGLRQSEASSYTVALPPAGRTLHEGLACAFGMYAEGKTGWRILVGTIYV